MRLLLSIVLLLPVGCSAQKTGVSGGDTQEPQEVQLRILAINDFHGNISTSSDAFGGVGRADYLAANIAAARARCVKGGDIVYHRGGEKVFHQHGDKEPDREPARGCFRGRYERYRRCSGGVCGSSDATTAFPRLCFSR